MDKTGPPLSGGATVAIIGAGAVGTSLAIHLNKAGLPIDFVGSKTKKSAKQLYDRLGLPYSSHELPALPPGATVVALTVPDNAIANVATALAHLKQNWSNRFVFHTSGAHTASLLAPLAQKGAFTFSLHPLQSFPPGGIPPDFAQLPVGIEGSPAGMACGMQLAQLMGSLPFSIPTDLKPQYHLAASMASNFLVTLVQMASALLTPFEKDPARAAGLLTPLIETTWENIKKHSGPEALTGPIVRGDSTSVDHHFHVLDSLPTLYKEVYLALGKATLDHAAQSNRLTGEALTDMKLLFEEKSRNT